MCSGFTDAPCLVASGKQNVQLRLQYGVFDGFSFCLGPKC